MKRPLEDQVDKLEKNPLVFLDIAVEEEKVGRIVIELFKDVTPRTAENFRALCTGEKGTGVNNKKLHYKGSIFHKVIPQFMIQGGDIINFNGTGGESIYGPHFEDESFQIPHSHGGLLSMVNEGQPNSNSSQFIITTVPCIHLDNTNVVFGKVIKGMGVVLEVNNLPVVKDQPVEKIHITDCGELKRGENWNLEENDGSEDVYTPWPEDWDYASCTDTLTYKYVSEVVKRIKDSGNHYFSMKNYVDAGRKYKKALRYYEWMIKMKNVPDTMEDSIKDLKVTIMLNLAAVQLKKKDYRSAVKLCSEVLEIDKSNGKAYFRRGQAHMGQNEYDVGLMDFKRALAECPNNKDILKEIEKVKKAMNSYLILEKATFQKMFRK
ncbi:peptidyl-prolyl cis-trans isomerase D [Polistes fuscatus]|uniref:peptidyl-prolyl cis-trans isomerase D n=1 Tax=Polistes fuscatus TaxID=30207 RepID=UPI001CA9DE75|nr:peptidyl-prolyl cis-trans isomerase D [Polistes fuscatus]